MNHETTRTGMAPARLRACAALAAASLAGAALATGADEAQSPHPRHRRVAAGDRYEAGAFHRFFLGSGYRRLWVEPIDVEVLDLATWSGGLEPEKKGGGKQTLSLRLEGRDGRKWKFRSIDKDPTSVLPDTLQDTFAAKVVQDQISACHPLGVLVVDALADAASVLHVGHRLVVLPDDPRLGEFRETFAGMLGTLEEVPSVEPPVTPGFAGFTKILETDELEELLDADSAERIDSHAYLRARLLDILVGDSDRHRDQWDWARDARTGRFVAVAADRDLAFVRFDGLLLKAARQERPQLIKFDGEYSRTVGLAWQARRVDRRHLADLEWAAWKQEAEALRSRLTDTVIDEACRRLPPPHFRLDGATLAARLKARRDGLVEKARSFYELLAREAEIHATDEPDTVQVLQHGQGGVEIVLAGPGGPYFRRRFVPDETREVRVFLKGGDDRAISEGQATSGITVRLVGGKGRDTLDDAAGQTRFYDSDDDSSVSAGPGTQVNARAYSSPVDRDGNPARDWGSMRRLLPWVAVSPDYGLVLGAAVERTGFAFRNHPYGDRHVVRAGYSTSLQTGGVEYEYDSLRSDNRMRFHVEAEASALELIHYYGFGNETEDTSPDDLYDVKVTQYALVPAYRLDLSGLDVRLGPIVKYADTHEAAQSLLALQQPYGTGGFGQVGARVGVSFDRTGLAGGRMTGGKLGVRGTWYPAAWSVTESFGKLEGQALGYLGANGVRFEPTLALRAGGALLLGRYPFHEAATLGGSTDLRGLPRQRYAGDASVFGNAELRLLLVKRDRALVPRFGVFGLADLGRVFLEGESSERWHESFGGGFWLAAGDPKNLVSVALAHGEGHWRFYFHGGFSF